MYSIQEQEQITQLGRMRKIATGLLLLMAVVFVVARTLEPTYSYLSFVRAFAEAAMVGALADWFAVTALFRAPLGLPIPHTAIIPNNKDRIGASIANFLEHNFMTREVLREELKQIDFAGAAAGWLAKPENSIAVSKQVVSGIPAMFRVIEDRDASEFMQSTLNDLLGKIRIAPLLAELLSVLIADRRHQALFDRLIDIAADTLEKNRPFIRQKIHDKSPRWMPKFIDEKLYEKLLEETQSTLNEMKEEGSEWRDRFQEYLEELTQNLKSSPQYEEKIRAYLDQLFKHPLFREYVSQVWQDIKGRLSRDAASENSKIVLNLDRAIQTFSLALKEDAAVQSKLNQSMRALLTEAIAGRRQAIAALVERVIQKWDAETVSRKFELYVGKDLQYIRINGTIVGGLVGVVLHAVSLML